MENKRVENAREALIKDLNEEMEKWYNAGEGIVLGIDANEDVRKGKVADWLKNFHRSKAR